MTYRGFGKAAGAAALAVAVLAGCGRDAAEQDRAQDPVLPGAGEVRPDLLIDAASLASASRQGDVVVLHVAADSADYAADHIAGAVYLPLSAVVVDRSGVPNELPPLEEVRAAFEARGVGDDRHVVVYGQPLHAARAFLALDVLGRVRLAQVGARSVGKATKILNMAVEYAGERRQFGHPIGDFQMVQQMLADSAIEINAARLALLQAAW